MRESGYRRVKRERGERTGMVQTLEKNHMYLTKAFFEAFTTRPTLNFELLNFKQKALNKFLRHFLQTNSNLKLKIAYFVLGGSIG